MTLLAFAIALGVLVTVHEWGHYRVAVACGVRVLRFAIGFGPALLRWTRPDRCGEGETEFVIGLIPLGGYVKMLDTREGAVPPAQQALAFDRQGLRARTAIVVAGPLANFVLAVLLYAATFCIGQWETRPVLSAPVSGSVAEVVGLHSGDVVQGIGTSDEDMREVPSLEDLHWWLMLHSAQDAVQLAVQDASGAHRRVVQLPADVPTDANGFLSLASWGLSAPWSRPVIGRVLPDGAAQRAGLQSGDQVLRIDGRRVEDAAQLRTLVRRHVADTDDAWWWSIERQGAVHELDVQPDSVREGDRTVGRIGALIGEAPARVWVERDGVDAVFQACARTLDVARLNLRVLVAMVTGQASWDNLSGPLSMAEFAGHSLHVGIAAYLAYLALLSASLGLFNLLPLPVLDGGHLMYYLYEFLIGRPPAARWLHVMQQMGGGLLVALMALAIVNDLNRLGWWP